MKHTPMVIAAFLLLSATLAQGEPIDTAVIPAKTEIFVRLQRTINTKTATDGDKFHGEIEVPVTAGDQIIIPVGSYIIGHVDLSRQAGRLKGKSELRLVFDSVILPDGVTRQIRAVVQSAESERTKPGDEEGTLQGGGGQASETAGGAAGGAIAGGVTGGLGTRSWSGAGVGAAIGAAAGGLIGALKKGEDVVLQRGSSITVQLEDDIAFAKPKPAGATP